MSFLKARSLAVLADLIAALPSSKQQRVQGIPLVFDDNLAEVNAFAACSNGKSAMALTAGILDIQAHLAQAAATDELFGTNKVAEYIKLVATTFEPGRPPRRPSTGFFTQAQAQDPRKIARQHHILDEQLAFVLGHELAHHYLGHLPCTAQGLGITAAEMSIILSSQVPVFNQPNEYGADVAATVNVLDAGARRPQNPWSERGGLLTMRFFGGLGTPGGVELLFAFQRSHPPPELRVPVIQTTAQSWRAGIRPLF